MSKSLIKKKATNKTLIPFRYPGGKFYAISMLKPFWELQSHDEYREPFVGGGSIFFSKGKSKYNWLNDIDDELINTYRVMSDKSNRERLVSLLDGEVASKDRWREVRKLEPKNTIEKAFKYYYLNRTSFSGKMVSPGWGYRPKRSLPPARWKERILPCGKNLEKVKLTSGDFEKVITSPSKQGSVLIFVDPPYFNPPRNKHYKHGFSYQDHMRLCKALKKTKHKFFLTYDDTQEVHNLYKWANIYKLRFFYRVGNSQTNRGKRNVGFELVITNYEVPLKKYFKGETT